jgi:thiol-disulfide isomerase/thioredoxin
LARVNVFDGGWAKPQIGCVMKRMFSKLTFALFGLVFAMTTSPNADAADATTLTKVGDASPIRSVRTVDGKNIQLTNQVVVLNFFATWCGPCMSEMPHLQKELWDAFKAKGLVVVAVGREHSQDEVEEFRRKKGYTFLFAADPKREYFGKFATQSIPRCVVIGKDGKIKYQSVGFGEGSFAGLVKAVEVELGK